MNIIDDGNYMSILVLYDFGEDGRLERMVTLFLKHNHALVHTLNIKRAHKDNSKPN